MFLPITGGMVLAGLTIGAFLQYPILSFFLGVCLAYPWLGYPAAFVLVMVFAIIIFNLLNDFLANLGPKSATDKINMYVAKKGGKKKEKKEKKETAEEKRRREERALEEFFRPYLEEESSESTSHSAPAHH